MEFIRRLFSRNDNLNRYITLKELSAITGIKYQTLYVAAKTERLKAYRSGHNWLSTVAYVRQAIEDEKLRGQ